MPEHPLKLLVTGCARSGTAYAASLLSRCGIPTTHEGVFGPYGRMRTQVAAVGESSWMAAPYLSSFTERTLVIHQVRNVDDVARSAVAKGMFSDEVGWVLAPRFVRQWSGRFRGTARGGRAFREFIRLHVPEVFEASTSEWDRAIQYWFRWNELIEVRCQQAGLKRKLIRVEDYDVDKILEIADAIEQPVILQVVRSAVESVSRRTNESKAGASTVSRPPELPPTVREMAHRYGVLARPSQS